MITSSRPRRSASRSASPARRQLGLRGPQRLRTNPFLDWRCRKDTVLESQVHRPQPPQHPRVNERTHIRTNHEKMSENTKQTIATLEKMKDTQKHATEKFVQKVIPLKQESKVHALNNLFPCTSP